MRVAAYYRVSSAAQRERDSIAGQRAEVRALITAHGWELVAEYEDDGRSARKGLAKRTGLADILQIVRAGRVDAVVFVAFDRLSRAESMRERGDILGDFQDAKCKIIISGGRLIDLGTFGGRVEANLLLELAAEESAEKSRRSKRGRARSAQAGRNPGRPPFGYACVDGAWSAPGTAVIREIFERVEEESCEAIAGDLNRRGLTSAGGRKWSGCTVADIVRRRPARVNGDPYVTGLWIGQKGEAAIKVPAIIPAELAERARAAIVSRRGAPPPPRTKYVQFLDEHAARCDLCGSWIRVLQCRGRVRKDGTRKRFAYYGCEGRARARAHGVEPCKLPIFRVEDVDAGAWLKTVEFVNGGSIPHRAAGQLAEIREQAGIDRDDARRKLAEATAALEALANALGDGAISAESYGKQAAKVKARRDLLAQQVATWDAAATETPEPDIAARAALRMEVLRLAAEADLAGQRALVRRVFPAWVASPNGFEAIKRTPVTAVAKQKDTLRLRL